RSAFDLYLGALALPPGSHILMSAITHPDMVAIVEAHGLVPIPVDIEPATMMPNLTSLQRAWSPQAKILVVAHLFGGRHSLDSMVTFCRQHDLQLVEDCAQVHGGGYQGSPLAEASLFSFGPMKTGTAFGGAVAVVREATVLAAMVQCQQLYDPQSRLDYAA